MEPPHEKVIVIRCRGDLVFGERGYGGGPIVNDHDHRELERGPREDVQPVLNEQALRLVCRPEVQSDDRRGSAQRHDAARDARFHEIALGGLLPLRYG